MAAPRRPAPIQRTIEDVEALKVISDPLRLKILEVTSRDPEHAWSAKELAASLGTSQTKLYHHLALMEEHRFLRVAETRIVSGIQERRYAATAHSFEVDRSLLSGRAGQAALSGSLGALFDKARAEIIAGIDAGLIDTAETRRGTKQETAAISSTHARLSPASVRKVMRQIRRLQQMDDADEEGGATYGLLIAFYPRADEDEEAHR